MEARVTPLIASFSVMLSCFDLCTDLEKKLQNLEPSRPEGEPGDARRHAEDTVWAHDASERFNLASWVDPKPTARVKYASISPFEGAEINCQAVPSMSLDDIRMIKPCIPATHASTSMPCFDVNINDSCEPVHLGLRLK